MKIDSRTRTKDFNLGKSSLESIANDSNFLIGFEVEFIAVPIGDRRLHRFSKISNLTPDELQHYMSPRKISYRDLFQRQFIPEYAQLLASDPKIENLFSDWAEYYKESNPNWEDFYSEEDLLLSLKEIFDKTEKIKIATELLLTKFNFMFRAWSTDKILELTNARPTYGYANPEKTEIWIDPIEIDYNHIAYDLSQELNTAIQTNGDSSRNWIIKHDGSLRPENQNEKGVEISSPALPLPISLEMMKKVFRWMQDRNYYTNKSCGFHIGVSYKNARETAKIDTLKLITLLGENYLLDLFNRQGNEYTHPHIPRLINELQKNPSEVEELVRNKNMKVLIRELNSRLDSQKYMTANLSKLANGYVEFRIAGGSNYNLDYERMRNVTLRYAYVMKIAGDPESFKIDYYKKLSRILLASLPGASGISDSIVNRLDPQILDYYKKVAPNISYMSQFRLHLDDALTGLINYAETASPETRSQGLENLINAVVDIIREDRRSEGRKILPSADTILLFRRIINSFKISSVELQESIKLLPYYNRIINLFFGLEAQK